MGPCPILPRGGGTDECLFADGGRQAGDRPFFALAVTLFAGVEAVRRVVLMLGLLVFALTARGGELRPDDFAYGIRLATPPDVELYRLSLPETVYRDVVDPRLADLRVFNAAGQVVPFSLVQTPSGAAGEVQARDLPIFPLPQGMEQENRSELAVVTGDDGHIMNVKGAATDLQAGAYLLDLSALPVSVRGAEPVELKLHWQHRGGTAKSQGFVTPLSIQASSDLEQWRDLDDKPTIADLEYSGRRISRNTVTLAIGKARYLRLDWPEGLKDYQLTRAEAFVRGVPSAERLQTMDVSAEPERPGSTASNTFEYDLKGPFPVRRVGLKLPQPNTLVRVRIESRASPSSSWLLQYEGVAYDLRLNGGSLSSGPVSVLPGTDRYWRVIVDQADGGLGGGAPTLSVRWQPHELYIVARGRGPFMLAFGNAGLVGMPRVRDAAVQRLREAGQFRSAKEVEARERVPLGGPGRLRPSRSGMSWARILPWAGLVLGFAALMVIVISVYRRRE